MTIRQLLQSLKDQVDLQSQFDDSETSIAIRGSEKEGSATVCIPVEGKIRVLRIEAKEVGVFEPIALGQ